MPPSSPPAECHPYAVVGEISAPYGQKTGGQSIFSATGESRKGKNAKGAFNFLPNSRTAIAQHRSGDAASFPNGLQIMPRPGFDPRSLPGPTQETGYVPASIPVTRGDRCRKWMPISLPPGGLGNRVDISCRRPITQSNPVAPQGPSSTWGTP